VGEGASVGAWAQVACPDAIWSVDRAGSRNSKLTAVLQHGDVWIGTGCFWGKLEDFEKQVCTRHGDNRWGREYRIHIDAIKKWAALTREFVPELNTK